MKLKGKHRMLTAHPGPQTADTARVEADFVDFFRQRGYASLPGSPLVDESIKMSFVMSAGLVQVEQALRLTGKPMERRFVLAQSCFRHFDMMENFGVTPYHLSLFRMAGAFLFGPIDRCARIAEIWILLSTVFQLKRESLWVTYFGGGDVFGHPFEPDTETRQGWLEVGMPARQVVGLDENFWRQSPLMGISKNLPMCGQNCEVFFDRGAQFACGSDCRPGCRCGRFVEFLNTLFIGWEHDPHSNQIQQLEEPFVEMVIGIERLAMILQGASSVYEVESLPHLFSVLEEFMGKNAVTGAEREPQMRLLADHLRAMLFLVADGAPPPGRGGRARIMRRLARNLLIAQKLLDLPLKKGHLLSPVIPLMLDLLLHFYQAEQSLPGQSAPRMLVAHPDLSTAPVKLLADLEAEARLFEQTLRNGLIKLDRMLARHPERLSGPEMLELEISAGIPVAYLAHILDQKQVDYSMRDYSAERARWQQATSRGSHLVPRALSQEDSYE